MNDVMPALESGIDELANQTSPKIQHRDTDETRLGQMEFEARGRVRWVGNRSDFEPPAGRWPVHFFRRRAYELEVLVVVRQVPIVAPWTLIDAVGHGVPIAVDAVLSRLTATANPWAATVRAPSEVTDERLCWNAKLALDGWSEKLILAVEPDQHL